MDPCSVMKSDIAPPVHQYVHFHFLFFDHYVKSASKFNTYLWHIVVCLPKGIFSLHFTAGRPVLILPDLSRSPTGGSSREDHIWSPTSKLRHVAAHLDTGGISIVPAALLPPAPWDAAASSKETQIWPDSPAPPPPPRPPPPLSPPTPDCDDVNKPSRYRVVCQCEGGGLVWRSFWADNWSFGVIATFTKNEKKNSH